MKNQRLSVERRREDVARGRASNIAIAAIIVLSLSVSALLTSTAQSGQVAPSSSGYDLKTDSASVLGSDFSTYLGGLSRDSNATGEATLNLTTAATLRQLWSIDEPGAFAAQAIAVNGGEVI